MTQKKVYNIGYKFKEKDNRNGWGNKMVIANGLQEALKKGNAILKKEKCCKEPEIEQVNYHGTINE